MANPVWVLSVDLQTKTATFQSGMADAAKSARNAFSEIKGGSGEMGREVGGNMMEARHGVMLLGEEFGIHLPRALSGFIASIGPIGAAMEAAFPFLAIAVGATLLIEALVKMHEEGEKLTQDQLIFATSVQSAFNQLEDKLLQAGIKTDELRNDHLGALAKQLELIDHQSMEELVKTFGELDKAADEVFKDIKSHWYTFGIGSTGAKHALEEFKNEYDNLLAKGKGDEASGLLQGTAERAKKILDMQKQAAAAMEGMKGKAGTDTSDQGKYDAAKLELKKAGVGYSEKEVQAQQILVDTLNAQVTAEEKIASLKKQESANTSRAAAGAMSAEASQAAKQAAESQLRMGELAVQADKATATARLAIQHASIDERLALEIEFADRDLAVKLAGNAAQMAALDKMAKDYPNQLKAMQEKALEISAQHENAVAELRAKAAIEQNSKDLQELEQSEREKIEATMKGSSARLAAIDAAIKEEEANNMQSLGSYRALLTERVQAVREASEQEAKAAEAAGKESADNDQKMGELALQAEKQHQALLDSVRRVSISQRIAQETHAADAEAALKLATLSREIAYLDKSGKDYNNKLKELQDKEKQLVQQHENDVTGIREKAQIERNNTIVSAERNADNAVASSMTQLLMGHKSFAATMTSIGDQVATGMIENAIKSILANDMTKESDAAAAARKAFLAGEQMLPGIPGVILGGVMAAGAFAAVMAFEGGGVVPGTGRGDVVPAMLTPGEGVVPGGVMAGLQKMVNAGDMGGGHHYHVTAHFAPHVHAVDSEGVDRMLTKHADKFQRHLESTVRRMNK